MASKAVNVILSLKDNLTRPMRQCTVVTKEMDRAIKKTQHQIEKFGKDANKTFLNVAKGIGKAGAAIGGLAVGAGLSEALDLEGYKTQLETATKDTEKASKIMQYAINLANKTPFEGGQLVEGAAKFEAMGMSAEKWLTLTGDMAAATNKDFDQAVEALIDAQTGELERLKEFGITKQMIVDQTMKMGMQNVVNNKGQITDMVKFNEALVALMQDKYTGGMDKLAKTVKGQWSTVTGVTKSALATLVGVSTDGSVRAGSALDYIRQMVEKVATRLQEWQQDGTLDAIAQKFDTVFNGITSVVSFFINHISLIAPVIAGVVAGFAAFNILSTVAGLFTTLTGVIKSAQVIMMALNAVMIANPFGVVAVAIGVLVAGFTMAYNNIAPFRDLINDIFNKLSGLASKAKSAGKVIGQAVVNYTPLAGRGFATGTSYFAGGTTRINEGGRGEIVNLPSGTQIIPHDVATKSVGKSNTINVSVNVQGNVIGNEEYADYMGRTIAGRLSAAFANI